jgi:endonuclease I
MSRKLTLCAVSLLLLPQVLSAQPPAGYYDTVDATDSTTLRATLHGVIDDHTRFKYTSSTQTDTWDILELADEDPANANNILDVYRNATYVKEGGGNNFYNREHSWPKSYGFPKDNTTNYPYTDCHHLFLSDDGYNSSRSNKPYRYCDASCGENPTDFNSGQGGGSGMYPGNSNWTSGSFTQGTWETWIGRRGDVARALFYLDVRYEGGTHGVTGAAEPDLILTDSEALIDSSNTGRNESVGYMGMLTVLLAWHIEDPVDALEQDRNDLVFSFQGNRNPFIDHPEWVDCLFNNNCGGGGDMTPPAAPTNLAATGSNGLVDLDWDDNGEGDLAGYYVYRATTSGGPYTSVNGALLGSSDYSDTTVTNGTTYYYVVTAVDTSSNESADSNEASATPEGGGGTAGEPWINEIHYNNDGADIGEFVEIAGPAGDSLTNWTVELYNGSGGASYDTIPLTGTFPDQGGCMGVLSFNRAGIQNGAPDGLALVDDTGTVLEFISYQGTFMATDGPANGMQSLDVGVAESASTPIGFSLQLAGTGSQRSDFTWQPEQAETPGSPNTGQTFDGCSGFPDCNNNGIDDAEDISTGASQDCDSNGVPDECQTDSDGDGLIDPCDGCPNDPSKFSPGVCGCGVADTDTDGDGVLDCDDNCVNTPNPGQEDCDSDGVGDACAGEPDCNGNGLPDSCDISSGTSLDLNTNGIPDECEGTATTMHVDDIVLDTANAGQGRKSGEATVKILDDLGVPVAGADVTGSFTGDFNEVVVATTDANGVAVLTTAGTKKGSVAYDFCVNSVTEPSLTYDSNDNVVTCGQF